MREWPESRVVITLLARVTRLRWAQAVVTGAAVGLALSAAVVLMVLLNGGTARTGVLVGLACSLVGAGVAWMRCDTSEPAAAAAVEAHVPACRNVVVTAAALLKDAGPTPIEVCRVVLQDAAQQAGRIESGRVVSWTQPAGRFVAAAALFAAVFLVKVPGAASWLPDIATEAASAPMVSGVHVTITPPAYTGLPVETERNPDRIMTLAGSRLDLRITGSGAAMTVETAAGSEAATREDATTFTSAVDVTSDGFVAIEPADENGAKGPRRLIGITATPDRPPAPRVTLPGKDMFLREATDTLAITAEATDDLGLRSLHVAYTKVAGVGESFTFTEGDVALTLTRTSARQWTGTGTLPLAALGLEVGDMVVYRALATDTRPGARPVESDAFIIEIVSASEAMAEGFAIDDTQDKYALSQQMVILKTERLIAKATSTAAPSAEVVREEALMVAAEQRSVRAELVFMTGGHFEDEFVEAAHEHEISDGRFANTGRADLARAIRDMSRASAELTESNLLVALDFEKSALEAMQRALSRRRFILRTLTQRESIDDTRRLTGTMSDVARARRAIAAPVVPPTILAFRDVMATLGDVAAAPALTGAHGEALTSLVGTLLGVGASDATVIDVVADLSKANEAILAGRQGDARIALTAAAARMTTILQTAAPASTAGDDAEMRRLRGALADAQRRGGGR